MASTLENLITEINDVHDAISDYSEKLGTYLFNPAQPFPELDESKLVIDELTMFSQINRDSAVDLVSGAMAAVVHKVAAISRELSVRTQTKAMLYDFAINEATVATDEVRGDGGIVVAEIRSTTPGQAEGT